MKILYAIQGTGNGHVSRAKEIIPILQQHGELDILVSGTQADIELPQKLAYKFHGFSYIFGKNGGINYWKTFKQMDLIRFWKDMRSIPLEKYDLIINDFEPLTAWACKMRKKESVALSHQASFVSTKTPRPRKKRFLAEQILKYYAPATHHIGFHFKSYDEFIHTPVIRNEIRELNPTNKGHYTVYLPAVDDKFLLKYFHQIKDVQWEVFSKHQRTPYKYGNVWVRPIENETYNKSLEGCAGLLTGGGFEGPAEALYLGKKVLLVPMWDQFEQICNAEAANRLGVTVVEDLKKDFFEKLKNWVYHGEAIQLNFPDETSTIVSDIVSKFKK
ncbi:hypothetical protein Pedsa_3213 [Pseudopedobacter saltans DSM 12145]|uniref:Glycosyl transferase n=1 Tax=Pseudopedobacter saltans (strain ATCC 51119 / DSM 12145 / JCM 21818 / CCUG 39354 / LMG 10337 / NBRC 100064 / NCIMB 13643) TaxID=762903 RepID=F0SBC2_PSESL|nr:glycosyltransferase family protein [Pseudopedobacter saltans]ADY53749.1 hypothetical protein Pedsa_3213 [Pseudopedobacter saltans DSM 12145]